MKLIKVVVLAVTLILVAVQISPAQDQDASSFVVGLNALNNQIKDTLSRQTTSRIAVVPFKGTENQFPRVSAFLAEQLITSLVASGDVMIVDNTSLVAALDLHQASPLRLGSLDEWLRLKEEYDNTSIIVGTITDLDSKIAVMARVINGTTGQFVGGAMVYLTVSDEFAALVDQDRPDKGASNAETGKELTATAEKPEVKTVDAAESENKKNSEKSKEAAQSKVEEQPVVIPEMKNQPDVVIYNEGRKYFLNKRFSAAITVFDQLLSRFPESPYADNAVYWIGESYYSKNEWEKARQQFQRVLDTYPYGNKVPDATYKRGFAEEKLGELDKAIFSMEEVVRRFGNAEIAVRAKEKLQRLRAAKQQS